MQETLTIRTLGIFSVDLNGKVISEESTRSHKIWKLFKYLITNRHRMVPIDTLIEVLWPDEPPQNPLKSLHTLISRLRKILNAANTNDKYILFLHDCYQWNPEIPINLDVSDFERLVKLAKQSPSNIGRQELLEEAIGLYKGDYLSESISEMWVLPVTNYYRHMFLQAVSDLISLYIQSLEYDDVIRTCNLAIQIEPYEESLYEHLIRALLVNNDVAQANSQFRRISELLQKQFGTHPSEGLQALKHEMKRMESEYPSDIMAIKQHLETENKTRNVFYCTPEVFKQIYLIDKRSDERMKYPVFLGTIAVIPKNGDVTDPKLFRSVVQSLRQCLVKTLRRGDVVSQYSKNQFMILLSAQHHGETEKALLRIKRIFMMEYSGGDFDLKMDFSPVE